MRIAIVLGFLLVAECAAQGSDVYRYEVKRGSELEKELGYKLSVQDEHDEERSEGMDAVIPIEGSAPDYFVKFRATVAGKLKDLFELDLTLNDANGTLLRVPLAIRSKWNKENEVDVRFPIKKSIRPCWPFAVSPGCRCTQKLVIPFDLEITRQGMRVRVRAQRRGAHLNQGHIT